MKKLAILACGVLAACALMLTACGDDSNLQVPTTVPTTEAHTHAFGEWATVKDATCNEEGEQERVCACGEKETQSIDMIAHTEVVDEAVAPSCNETGLTEGKHCLVCNEILLKQEIVEAAHSWSAKYQKDEAGHWRCCDKCDVVGEKLTHVLHGKICDVCEMETTEGMRYMISADGTYAIAHSYYGSATWVRIAEEYRGLPVTKIDSEAFKEKQTITEVIIPDSVTIIGEEAFRNCFNLTNVTIPDSVVSVGSRAFYGCARLQYSEYGGCKYLGNAGNPYLVLITTVDSNECNYTIHHDTRVIAGRAFASCASLTGITIPDGIITIGVSAFEYCNNLTSVTIGNGVTTIGARVFMSCSSLTSVIIPDNVTAIGLSAFRWCISLTSVTIPDSITTVDEFAFDGCGELQYAEYGNCKYLGNAANPYLVLITAIKNNGSNYTIHHDTRVIAGRAFASCASISSMIIPDGVITIGPFAFDGCVSLAKVTMGNSVTTIDAFAFNNCGSVATLYYFTIYFNGTVEQWNAINKNSIWGSYTRYCIRCTDADIIE